DSCDVVLEHYVVAHGGRVGDRCTQRNLGDRPHLVRVVQRPPRGRVESLAVVAEEIDQPDASLQRMQSLAVQHCDALTIGGIKIGRKTHRVPLSLLAVSWSGDTAPRPLI